MTDFGAGGYQKPIDIFHISPSHMKCYVVVLYSIRELCKKLSVLDDIGLMGVGFFMKFLLLGRVRLDF